MPPAELRGLDVPYKELTSFGTEQYDLVIPEAKYYCLRDTFRIFGLNSSGEYVFPQQHNLSK